MNQLKKLSFYFPLQRNDKYLDYQLYFPIYFDFFLVMAYFILFILFENTFISDICYFCSVTNNLKFMILNEREDRHEHTLNVARQMMTAARTAPKGKGLDIIEVAMITDDEIQILSKSMVEMVAEHGMKFFLRDAENILNAECIVLIGTHEQAQGLNCGHCGYATCVSRKEGVALCY